MLSKMVKELILDNDKVVLPGLGAFVAEIVPATFSDRGYTIHPPYRKLYFRAKPNEGDALVNFYMSTNHLDRDVAEKVICEFISELKSVLHAKKTVIFPGLGRLRATKENTIFFVADENLDIYPEGFGLEPISLKAHQETAEEVSAMVSELKSIVDPVVETSLDVEQVEESVIEDVVVEQVEEVLVIEQDEEAQEGDQVEEVQVTEQVEEIVEEESVVEETVAEEPEVEISVSEELPVEELQVKARGGRKILKVLLIVLIVSVVLLAAFAVLARMNPEMFDSLLYTQEELEILNS